MLVANVLCLYWCDYTLTNNDTCNVNHFSEGKAKKCIQFKEREQCMLLTGLECKLQVPRPLFHMAGSFSFRAHAQNMRLVDITGSSKLHWHQQWCEHFRLRSKLLCWFLCIVHFIYLHIHTIRSVGQSLSLYWVD